MFTSRYLIISLAVGFCVAIISLKPAKAVPISEHEKASRRLYKAHGFCVQNSSTPTSMNKEYRNTEQKTGAYLRCVASNMGLWTDASGYHAKRVAKFFIKEHNENEVMT
uniref:Uncharacterized protein n=2 Tax=Bactrocera latifrons TaxID=174628 RepID=A0A0K8ULS7_BACLA